MDFKSALRELNIEASKETLDKFEKYFEILVSWNEKMNLTAITERDEVYRLHFLDSIAGMAYAFDEIVHSDTGLNADKIRSCMDLNSDGSVAEKMSGNLLPTEIDNDVDDESGDSFAMVDIGTGAGFPGVPIKLVYPNTKVLLLDSLNKRIEFLNNLIDELDIDNIYAVHARAEEGAKFNAPKKTSKKQKADTGKKSTEKSEGAFRESFDIATSRAVSDLSILSEYCLPYVKRDGYFISYKSADSDDEIKSAEEMIETLGGKIIKIKKYTLPGTDINRSVVIIKKVNNTPDKYPRRQSKIKRK